MKTQYLLFFCLLFGFALSCKKTEETTPKSPKKEITANPTVDGIAGATVSYDAATFTYTINVPAATDVKALKLTIPISAGATISPDPATARDYTNPVKYTVMAEDGSTQAYTVKVMKSTSSVPVAGFTIQNNGCQATCTIGFTNTSTNASSYTWTFGDGSQSTQQNPTRQYTTPGNYTVTLAATGPGGTATAQQSVTILGTSTTDVSKIWDKTFGGTGGDLMSSVVGTSDGGFLLAGNSESIISGNKTAAKYGNQDYWVVKTNANGDKVWDKTFGGTGYDAVSSVVGTSDGWGGLV